MKITKKLVGKKEPETVNHPSHYNQGKIEVIEFITDQQLDFCEGNVVKYVSRHKHKNGLEDLKKAQFYLNYLIATLEGNSNGSKEKETNRRIEEDDDLEDDDI